MTWRMLLGFVILLAMGFASSLWVIVAWKAFTSPPGPQRVEWFIVMMILVLFLGAALLFGISVVATEIGS